MAANGEESQPSTSSPNESPRQKATRLFSVASALAPAAVALEDGNHSTKQDLLLQAIDADPTYALPYIALVSQPPVATRAVEVGGASRTELDLLITAISLDPSQSKAYSLLALAIGPNKSTVRLKDGTSQSQQSLFLRAIHLNPSSSMDYVHLALTLKTENRITLLNGNNVSRRELFLKAIEFDPTNARAIHCLAVSLPDTFSQHLLPDGKRYTRKDLLLKALEYNPTSSETYLALARDASGPAESIPLLLKAIDVEPVNSEAFATLAKIVTPYGPKVTLLDGRTLSWVQIRATAVSLSPELETLDLEDCDLTNEEFRWVCQCLRDHPRLSTINISHNPKLGIEGLLAANSLRDLEILHTGGLLTALPPEFVKRKFYFRTKDFITNELTPNNLYTRSSSKAIDPSHIVSFANQNLTDEDAEQLKAGQYKIFHANFSFNQLQLCSVLPRSYPQLIKLEITHNKVENLYALVELPSLTYLDVSFNQISTLPLTVDQWKYLSYLNLRQNKLRSVVELGALKSLEIVDISHNQLTDIPLTLVEDSSIRELTCHENPLKSPLTLLATKSKQNPVAFLRQLKREGGKPWMQVKLVICGKGGVGKTHLTRRLQGLDYPTRQQTDGLEVHLLKEVESGKKAIQFCVFDLGGQDVFYPTHQFFMSGNAMYLVVFKAHEVDESNIEYWIRVSKSVHPTSGPQIILVGTHIDMVDKKILPMIADNLIAKFNKIAYPGKIQSVYWVTSTPGFMGDWFSDKGGLQPLREGLAKIAEASPIFSQIVPQSYRDVADMLMGRRETYPYIELEDFKAKFLSNLDLNDAAVTNMLTLFHDTGVVIWFNWPETRNLVILDPQWLARVMAGLVSFTREWKRGIVTATELASAWSSHPKGYFPAFIKLMTHFEIIYKISENAWAIPCMLSPQVTKEFEDKAALIRRASQGTHWSFQVVRKIHFGFVPKGFFSKLAVRLMRLENVEQVDSWLNGFILQDRVAYALPTEGEYSRAHQTAVASLDIKERILLEFDDITNCLTVTGLVPVFKRGLGLFANVLNSITSIITTSYKSAQNFKSDAICYHCLQHNLADVHIGNESQIDTAIISQIFSEGFFDIPCPVDPSAKSPILFMAPDICLSHVTVIEAHHITDVVKVNEGGYGVIYKATFRPHKSEAIPVAIKTLKVKPEADPSVAAWHHETFLMGKLKEHPNVVRLYGIMLNPVRNVMEYCNGGDLNSFYKSKEGQSLDWKGRVGLLLNIAKGMAYLHSMSPPIIHRDLRSPNIFLSMGPGFIQAKVGDFGLAHQFATPMTEQLLTWEWLAPEVIKASSSYNERADIYSFAMIIWHTIHPALWPFQLNEDFKVEGRNVLRPEEATPEAVKSLSAEFGSEFLRTENSPDGSVAIIFKTHQQMQVRRAIVEQNYRPAMSPEAELSTPKGLIELMQQCWLTRPDDRPGFDKIVQELEQIRTGLRSTHPHAPADDRE